MRFVAFMAVVGLSLAAVAFMPAPVRADETPEQTVAAVQDYLNSISTLEARFQQTDTEGKQLTGVFMLKRPGRLRIDYDAPSTDFIVSDGTLVYYYDGQLKQQSSAPVSRSLADFFLRKQIYLSGDISVSDIKHEKSTIEMTLTQTKNPLAGSLTMVLNAEPLHLLQWTIVDVQGLVTKVRLLGSEEGITLSNTLFHYANPEHKEPMYNQNK